MPFSSDEESTSAYHLLQCALDTLQAFPVGFLRFTSHFLVLMQRRVSLIKLL